MSDISTSRHDNSLLSFPRRWPKLIAAIIFIGGLGVYLATDESTWWLKALHKLGELAALGVALNIISNYALKNAERQVLLHELDARTVPLQNKLDLLDAQVQAASQLTKFKGLQQAKSRWLEMVSRNSKLYLVGEVPPDFALDVKQQLFDGNKTLSVHVSLGECSPAVLSTLLALTQDPQVVQNEVVRMFHLERLAFGFIALACNSSDTEAEVLINYKDGDRIGMYITGQTALSMLRAYQPRLDSSESPQIACEAMLDALRTSWARHQAELKELRDLGIPARGTEQLCELMIHTLQQTRKTLLATHIATSKGIQVMKEPPFQKWLAANYQAAASNVAITRIFIVPKVEVNNPILRQMAADMRTRKIDVRIREMETLMPAQIKDFTVYDGVMLVRTDDQRTANPGWIEEHVPVQREPQGHMTCDRALVTQYENLFHALLKSADTRSFPLT